MQLQHNGLDGLLDLIGIVARTLELTLREGVGVRMITTAADSTEDHREQLPTWSRAQISNLSPGDFWVWL
jgi:hypothetical protein